MLADASCGHLLQQLATQAPPAHCWSPHHTSTGFLPTLPSSPFWTPDLCSLSHPALSWTGNTPQPHFQSGEGTANQCPLLQQPDPDTGAVCLASAGIEPPSSTSILHHQVCVLTACKALVCLQFHASPSISVTGQFQYSVLPLLLVFGHMYICIFVFIAFLSSPFILKRSSIRYPLREQMLSPSTYPFRQLH